MLWRLKRIDGKPVLEHVAEQERMFKDNQRSVVLFPGAGVWDRSSPQDIAGSLKYLEQTLAPTLTRPDAVDDTVNTYLWTYDEPYEAYGAHAAHYKGSRTLSVYGRKVGQFVVVPFLLKEGESFSQLTPETLKERLSHMTLLGHSFGSIMNQDVANYLNFEMKRNGWSDATISDVLKELVSVSVASIARQDIPAPNATQYFFTATNDTTAKGRIGYHLHNDSRVPGMLQVAGYPEEVAGEAQKVKIRPLGTERGYAMRVALPEDEIRWTEISTRGEKKFRVLDARTQEESQVKLTHDYRNFLNGHQVMGTHLTNIMNNAVLRQPGIGTGHQLFERTRMALIPDPQGEASIGIPESIASKAERARG